MCAENLRNILRGYGRSDPDALRRLAASHTWVLLACMELARRHEGAILRVLERRDLEAVATGQVDMAALCEQVLEELADGRP